MNVQDIAVGTIVTKSFLGHARTLAHSLQRQHPELTLFVLLADEVGGCFDPAAEPFRVVRLEELSIPGLRPLLFRYTTKQVLTALKPYFLDYLLAGGARGALLLDADLLVLADLEPLLDATVNHSIVLTPHLLSPPRDADRVERELVVLRAGVYNAGVLGVSQTPAGRCFLAWLQRRLHGHCHHAIEQGLHFDQRWLDLVPGAFEDVHVLRDPGCNVAWWNLAERPIRVREDGVTAAGRPCRLFHFSGFDPAHPLTVTRYAPRPTLAEVGPAVILFERYFGLLEAAGQERASRWPYAYGRFADGVAIPDVARQLYQAAASTEDFGDPFRTDGARSFLRWLTEPVDAAGSVSRLWDAVYRLRPDLQRAFPDVLGGDREAFLKWTHRTGWRDHSIPEPLRGCGRGEGVMSMPLGDAEPGGFRPQLPWAAPPREACTFYHCLDFPDGESVTGHWDLRGRFSAYVGGYPLSGKSVLDVGTASGFLAFSAEAAGARVTALDLPGATEFDRVPFHDSLHYRDRAAWAARWDECWFRPLRNGFWYAWHKYRSGVEVVYAPMRELCCWKRRFDVVIAGAIVEHLADPVSAIAALARLADEAVILAFTDVGDSEEPLMRPMTAWTDRALDHGWWMLSRGLYRQLFANLGFDVEFRRCTAVSNPAFVNSLAAPVEVERPTIVARRRHPARP
jgi:Methyltransferase domain